MTFHLDLELEHSPDASSPGDHRAKFGRDPATFLVEEAICAKYLQTDGQTNRQTARRTTVAARSY